ncbi:hypothetical protein ACFRKB_06540 [Streptomyces scopuliridis]
MASPRTRGLAAGGGVGVNSVLAGPVRTPGAEESREGLIDSIVP